jgi:hypothetical protein
MDSVQDLALRRQQETRRVNIARALVGAGAGDRRDFIRISAVAHREGRLELSIVPTVVASLSTDNATTLMPDSASFSLAR